MDTKEAIQFLEQLKISNVYTPESYRKHLKDTQELLQQGEKYRLMWEEFKKCCSLSIVFDGKLQNIKDKMNWFEQKYFPKQKAQGNNPIEDFMEFSKYIDMKRQREKESNQDYKQGEE